MSVEHILPESLGNTTQTLPPGVVCDQCNNYFARKVEQPFLESGAVAMLRFNQRVPNKRGLVPLQHGILLPEYPAEIRLPPHGASETDSFGIVSLSLEGAKHLLDSKNGKLVFPAEGGLPKASVVSRFVAKVALESMAQRLVPHAGGVDYLIDEVQLDLIRLHARRGETREWPVSVRRIYEANAKWIDADGADVQLVHESDILQTESGEWYFIVAIFGVEFAINYGGPTIEGYDAWLSANNNASPLHIGKNASVPLKPAG